MANAVIVGTQWGDEGKAKVIDGLTQRSDLIIRFQGGANAGHTVIANGQKFVFHLVPSGIMYSDKICIVGNGVVFDCEQFLKEIDELESKNISVDGRMFVPIWHTWYFHFIKHRMAPLNRTWTGKDRVPP